MVSAMQPFDWMVIAAYAIVVIVIGLRAGRGRQSAEDYFLGGRKIPWWAALCSMVATELSAATFIGTPQKGFGGDWTYLQYAIGSLLARVVLATWFISLYYRLRLVTVYGLLGQRFGRTSELTSAWLFLGGRLIASGSRLFIAGLAFATVTGTSIEVAILIAGGLAMAYTLVGGIRAVIWTDTLQGAVFIVSAIVAIVVAVRLAPEDAGGIWSAAVDADKTTVIREFFGQGTSLFAAIVGGFFLTMATHGTDQDMVQRLLTTSNSRRGGLALVLSGVANFPVVILFLFLGTAMWAYYRSWSGTYDIGETEKIFPLFVLKEVPTGLRGLIFAGLFAAAMSSMDSALNSLATTWVVNIRGRVGEGQEGEDAARVATTQRATLGFGALLVAAGLGLVFYKRAVEGAGGQQLDLIDLALSSMSIFYGGLLGGFVVALLTPHRGTDLSVTIGMAAGGVLGVLLFLHPTPLMFGETYVPWVYWILSSATVAFVIGASVPKPEALRD
ncbi:MAG: hypothetical protein CMJ83_06345 [Planctomycetes bacterium]|nr:hypothetical protein [Planctomycetota bacterium]